MNARLKFSLPAMFFGITEKVRVSVHKSISIFLCLFMEGFLGSPDNHEMDDETYIIFFLDMVVSIFIV